MRPVAYLSVRVLWSSQRESRHMERLYFSCPVSGRDIDVGIETELNTLLHIRGERIIGSQCPDCGGRHEWQVGDAHLPERCVATAD